VVQLKGSSGKPAFNGWRIVRSSLVIQVLHSGLVFNSFSLFAKELKSEYGWSNGQLGLAFSLNRAESGLLGPLQGWMTDKWGPRVVIRIGAVVMAAGLWLFGSLNSLGGLYTYYLLVALGSSLSGFLSITVCIVNWFERKRSRALAFGQAGFAVGGVLAAGVGFSIDSLGWRDTSRLGAVAVLVVILPLSRYFDRRPSDVGQFIDGIDPDDPDAEVPPAPLTANTPTAVHFTASEAMRTKAFWFIALGHASALLVVGATMAHLAVYLDEEVHLSGRHAAFVVGALPAVMGVGQIVGGFLGDLYDKRKLTAMAMFGHSSGLIVLALASGPVLVWLFVLLNGLAWGVRGPLQQAMRADYFGATDFGKIMGFSSLVIMMGMVLGPIVAGALADRTGSFTTGFIVLAVAAGFGAIWFWAAKPPVHPSSSDSVAAD
jgi:MFS family permease